MHGHEVSIAFMQSLKYYFGLVCFCRVFGTSYM